MAFFPRISPRAEATAMVAMAKNATCAITPPPPSPPPPSSTPLVRPPDVRALAPGGICWLRRWPLRPSTDRPSWRGARKPGYAGGPVDGGLGGSLAAVASEHARGEVDGEASGVLLDRAGGSRGGGELDAVGGRARR